MAAPVSNNKMVRLLESLTFAISSVTNNYSQALARRTSTTKFVRNESHDPCYCVTQVNDTRVEGEKIETSLHSRASTDREEWKWDRLFLVAFSFLEYSDCYHRGCLFTKVEAR